MWTELHTELIDTMYMAQFKHITIRKQTHTHTVLDAMFDYKGFCMCVCTQMCVNVLISYKTLSIS